MSLTRKQWEALGSLGLPREIGGRLQVHPATAKKLLALGYITERQREERDRRGKFTWTEHVQTVAGNMAWCAWAAKQKGDEP